MSNQNARRVWSVDGSSVLSSVRQAPPPPPQVSRNVPRRPPARRPNATGAGTMHQVRSEASFDAGGNGVPPPAYRTAGADPVIERSPLDDDDGAQLEQMRLENERLLEALEVTQRRLETVVEQAEQQMRQAESQQIHIQEQFRIDPPRMTPSRAARRAALLAADATAPANRTNSLDSWRHVTKGQRQRRGSVSSHGESVLSESSRGSYVTESGLHISRRRRPGLGHYIFT